MTVDEMQNLKPGDIVCNQNRNDRYRVIANDGTVVTVERVFDQSDASLWSVFSKVPVNE